MSEKEVLVNHCYHDKERLFTVPEKVLQVCCFCGKRRYGSYYMGMTSAHGRFLPAIAYGLKQPAPLPEDHEECPVSSTIKIA